MKPGRNDPCICSSGKKYKQCCLKVEQPELSQEEGAHRRLQRETKALPLTIGRFAVQAYGTEGIRAAWAKFLDDENAVPNLDSPLGGLFFSWLLYFWSPLADSEEAADATTSQPLAAIYLAHAGRRMSDIAKRYIEAAVRAPMTFVEVLSFEVGRSLRVRDLFTGVENTILENVAPTGIQGGNILLAMPVHCEGVVVFEMVGPTLLPPFFKPSVVELSKVLGIGAETTTQRMRELDLEIISAYCSLESAFLYPERAQLLDGGGEPSIIESSRHYPCDTEEGEAETMKP